MVRRAWTERTDEAPEAPEVAELEAEAAPQAAGGPPAGHVHVSERTSSGGWWACTECSTVMLSRRAIRSTIPATYPEAVALRETFGSPGGGATVEDMRGAIDDRYGLVPPKATATWANLRSVLTEGRAALVQGGMDAWSSSSHWRRWDPGFDGYHAVYVARWQGQYWWDDPLAPVGSYKGEPIPEADLAAYVNAWSGAKHLVMADTAGAPAPGGDMSIQAAESLSSGAILRFTQAGAILDTPTGEKVADAAAGAEYPFVGVPVGAPAAGSRAVLVRLAGTPTILYAGSVGTVLVAPELAPEFGLPAQAALAVPFALGEAFAPIPGLVAAWTPAGDEAALVSLDGDVSLGAATTAVLTIAVNGATVAPEAIDSAGPRLALSGTWVVPCPGGHPVRIEAVGRYVKGGAAVSLAAYHTRLTVTRW